MKDSLTWLKKLGNKEVDLFRDWLIVSNFQVVSDLVEKSLIIDDNELGKITFGKEGSGGLLDPNLKTDQLVSQVGRVNTILGRNNTVQTSPPNLNTSRRDRRRGSTAGNQNTVIDNSVRSTNVNNSAPIITNKFNNDLQDCFSP